MNARKHVEDEIYWKLFLEGGGVKSLKYRCTVCIHAASLQGSKDHERVWLCLAAHCSQDAFCFLSFSLFLPKTSGYWQDSYLVVIYFVKILHVTCSNPKSVNVQLKRGDGIAKLCTFCVYSCYAPWHWENWANRVALHDAALVMLVSIRVQSLHAAKDKNGCWKLA